VVDAFRALAARDLTYGSCEAWQEEILNYFEGRQTSAPVEGVNNMGKVIVKRAYGLMSAGGLWGRLILGLNRVKEAVRHTIEQVRELVAGFRAIFLPAGGRPDRGGPLVRSLRHPGRPRDNRWPRPGSCLGLPRAAPEEGEGVFLFAQLGEQHVAVGVRVVGPAPGGGRAEPFRRRGRPCRQERQGAPVRYRRAVGGRGVRGPKPRAAVSPGWPPATRPGRPPPPTARRRW
jgi:hypothetical protein